MQASQVLQLGTGKTISLWRCFVHGGIIMLKQERTEHKPLPKKLESPLLSKISLYAVELRTKLIGSKRQKVWGQGCPYTFGHIIYIAICKHVTRLNTFC